MAAGGAGLLPGPSSHPLLPLFRWESHSASTGLPHPVPGSRIPPGRLNDVRVIRILTICLGAYYTYRMHALESIFLVLSTALLWAAFTLLMLARLNREGRRAQRQARKASRMKTRPELPTDVPDRPGRGRRHRLKVWRHHPSSASGGAFRG